MQESTFAYCVLCDMMHVKTMFPQIDVDYLNLGYFPVLFLLSSFLISSGAPEETCDRGKIENKG